MLAQRGAEQLKKAGLSEECDIPASLVLSYSLIVNLVCTEHRDKLTSMTGSITLTLPTGARAETWMEVESAFSELKGRFEAHAFHKCEIASLRRFMTEDLEHGRAVLLRALNEETEGELKA